MSKYEIELGRMNRLKVAKKVDFGYYLEGYIRGERTQILLPNNEIKEGSELFHIDNVQESSKEASTEKQPSNTYSSSADAQYSTLPPNSNEAPPLRGGGGEVEVFIYLDQSERLVATTERPYAQVGDFAFLEVAWVNQFGAFLDWGLMKDLFVPFREQKMKMQKGKSYIVHVHLDEDSYRIMASAKVERYLDESYPPYQVGDEVEVLIWQKTDLGLKVIVNNRYAGLLYDDQVFRELRTGDFATAYVSRVRPDGKLDLRLSAPGQAAVADFSEELLQYLKDNGGHTVLCDKSPADDIYEVFGVSKKVFKKAVGDLYKRRLIELKGSEGKDGLWLVKEKE